MIPKYRGHNAVHPASNQDDLNFAIRPDPPTSAGSFSMAMLPAHLHTARI